MDKIGWQVLFLDPETYVEVKRLAMPARPHEVAISPDHRRAFVSIYGNGIYGNNSEPGRQIITIDLENRCRAGEIDVDPYRAPHGLMWGADSLLYASCDHSGVVAVIDPLESRLVGAIETASHGCHMIAMLPDGSKLYAENEDDQPFVSVLDPVSRKLMNRIPVPDAAGIVASPDGRYVLVTHASSPVLSVIDTAADREIERVSLQDQTVSAQRVRWSPDGRHVVVTSMDEPLVTVFTQDLRQQATFSVADGPMGVAFALDGHTALVANHNAGQVTVIDLDARARKAELPAGKGVETLAFY